MFSLSAFFSNFWKLQEAKTGQYETWGDRLKSVNLHEDSKYRQLTGLFPVVD